MQNARLHQTRNVLGSALLLLAACGSSDTAPPAAATVSSPTTAAAAGAAAAPPSAHAELEALFSRAVSGLMTQLVANCPCFVSMGAYKSVDECLMWQMPHADWVPCGTSALAPYDSPELRQMLQCLADVLDKNTACLATKPCDADARAECGQSPLQCVGAQVEALVSVGMKCPDLTLLPRQ